MKKTLLSLTLLFASSIVVHAQWTTSGTTTTTTNSVGIGTSTAPVSTFQINSGFLKFCAGNAGGVNLNYGTSYIGFNAARSGSGSTASWTIDGDGFHNGAGVIFSDVSGNIFLAPLPSTGGTVKNLADVDIKGNVTLKIANNGAVYAKAISVQTTGWPDYIFKPAYKLPSLNEVKAYIDQNQHLPEIPSEQQIAKDGLNLGEMNKLLMKKVEELTLYAIENEQKDKEKDKLLASLQQQINELKGKHPRHSPKK